MQATTSGLTVEALDDSAALKEQAVTFQIAMVGCDGIVIGSDRKAVYAPGPGAPLFPQVTSQEKYFASESGSIVCFASGSAIAIDLARQISVDYDPALRLRGESESAWKKAISGVVAGSPNLPPGHQLDEEILVARKDVADAFWFVLRRPFPPLTILKIQGHLCTGAKTVARFLPRHLWSPELTILQLKRLAVLTLSYAAQEEPSFVGEPFDVMTIDRAGNVEWSVHDRSDGDFQQTMNRLFLEHGA